MSGSPLSRAPAMRALRAVLVATPPCRWDTDATGAVMPEPGRARDERSYVVYFPPFDGRRPDTRGTLPASFLVVAGSDLRLTRCPMTATKFVSARAAADFAEGLPAFPRGGPPAEVRELTLWEHPQNYTLSPALFVPVPKSPRQSGKLKGRPPRKTAPKQ